MSYSQQMYSFPKPEHLHPFTMKELAGGLQVARMSMKFGALGFCTPHIPGSLLNFSMLLA